MGRGVALLKAVYFPILFMFFFGAAPRLARADNVPPISNKEILDFADLLKHYTQYPDYIQLLEADEKALIDQFKKFDSVTLKNLPADSFRNLYQRFYVKFVGFRETRDKLVKQVQTLKDRKIALPLDEKKSIVELDLKIKASEDQIKQARFVLFSTSFDANKALLEMLKSPSVKALAQKESAARGEKEKAADPNAGKPKLPGTPQESRAQRSQAAESDKLNLTPVDPEFYNSQLGKKLEKDLGGKADFWSYDFDQDELYVVVGDEIGKLRVKQRDQGTRIIQTRVGSGFQDFPSNYQGDQAVDLNNANGRFLTGNPADPTLFGAFPSQQPEQGIPEGVTPPVHPKNGSHP